MKVFYIASSKFRGREDNEFYDKTLNYIQFKVGKKNLLTVEDHYELDSGADPKDIIKNIKKSEKALKKADVCIADITDNTGGVGFRIAQAVLEKKPTLVVRNKNEENHLAHSSVTAGVHRNITYKEYDTPEEITKYVDNFLEDAKNKIDTKFILIIPPDIDKYLNWASDFKRLHKAQVVRKAIEKEMARDKDWKTYLKSNEL